MYVVKKSDSMSNKKDEIFKKLKDDEKLLEDNIEQLTKEEENISDSDISNNENSYIENKKNKYTWQIYLAICFIIIVISFNFIYLLFMPKLTLNGQSKIELDYNEEYKEFGYKLTLNKKDLTNKVKIKGKVNSKKLGVYTIEYYYKKGIFKTSKKRIIKVKDKTKPLIILDGSKNTYICPNTEYKNDKYQAIDNYDGDITKKVKVIKKEDRYIYQVEDSSGNKTKVIRKIIKKDRIVPSLTLKGDKVVNITQGETYKESGYTAIDNCDNDITEKVIIEGNIDINTIGSYELKYKVSDNSKNETIVTRTVNVLEKSKKGVIYLTFDDGPNEGTTNVILDILKEEGVKATFFVTNKGPDELIKREYEEGHSIALHTATHNYATIYSSDAAYFADLEAVQKRVENITGYKSMLIRFPGGSSNTISRKYNIGIMKRLTNEVLARGYKYYDWNISSGDAGETNTSEGVYQNVVSRISHDKVNMILMHDIKPYTRDALKAIIHYAKENGYIFDKITDSTDMVMQRVNN